MKPGRNDPCPCGSGQKFKKCCGSAQADAPARVGYAATAASAPPVGQLAALMNQGQFAQAELEAHAMLREHPRVGSLWKMLGTALVMQGKDAMAALREAQRLLPDDAQTHFYLGMALQDRGEYEAAVENYARALATRPDWAEAHNDRGTALMALDRPEDALSAFRTAIALQPTYPEAHGNLGDALQTLGRPAQAVASYRRLLELRPTAADGHNNLGNALVGLGQFTAAVASYHRALELQPQAAGTLASLGNALRSLGSPLEAAAVCRRALALAPTLTEAHHYLGNALFDLGRFDQAAASYNDALASNPEYAQAHTALSIVLRQMGRSAEAEACCRRALQLQPSDAASVALLGEIVAIKGDFADADDLFKRALAIDPQRPEAWAGMARNRKMGAGDSAWLAAVQRLAAQPLPLHQQINLRFALGKYFDDVEDYSAAFHNYRAANELTKRYGVAHDRVRLTQRVDRLISDYDAAAARATTPVNASNRVNASQRAVFVVGMPRAGTSLAEQILASHPAVFGAGELRFWHAAAAKYDAAPRDAPARAGILTQLARDYLTELEQLSRDALRVVDKMPANTMNVGLIHAALPNARIIHIQRNPIDTCLSIYFQVFSNTHAYANDLGHLTHYYQQYLRLMDHWRSMLPADAILEVPYEGLVEATELWSRKMLNFIGLPWDPRCLEFHATKRNVATASNWQVRQKISHSSVGRWHNYAEFIGPLRNLSL